jgi:hypothetical protein
VKNFDIRAVTFQSALAWARGEIHDSRLDPSRPEIIFWNELLDKASYRAALQEFLRLARSGCRAMIVHACHEAVYHRLEKAGCVCTVTEHLIWQGNPVTARRYVLAPEKFQKLVHKGRTFYPCQDKGDLKNVAHIESCAGKISKNSRAESLVTISR